MNIFSFSKSYFTLRILEESKRRAINSNLIDPLCVSISENNMTVNGDIIPLDIPFCFRGSAMQSKRECISSIASYAEFCKCRLVNSHDSMMLSADKWRSRLCFLQNGLCVPPAVIPSSKDCLDDVIFELGGFPLVAKTFFGSGGSGVIFIPDKMTMRSVFDFLKASNNRFFFEKFIFGKVLRAIVIGDTVNASFEMIPENGDFRTNSSKGGIWRSWNSTECSEYALMASKSIKLGFCAVDMIESEGKLFVMEINSSPGIEKAESISNKNISSDFMDYALSL